jgi:hypothetical protein
MRFGNLPGDCQTQPCATLSPAAGAIGAVESLEDVR